MRRFAITAALACCALTVMSCADRQTRVQEQRVRSTQALLGSNATMDVTERIRNRALAVSTIDSLLQRAPTGKHAGEWRLLKEHYVSRNKRDRQYALADSLVCLFRHVRLDSLDARGYDTTEEKLEIISDYLRLCELTRAATAAFTDAYPDDPSSAEFAACSDSVRSTQVAGYLLSYALIYVETLGLAALGETMCKGVSEVWDSAIDAGLSFQPIISRLIASVEVAQGATLDKHVDDVRLHLRLFHPPDDVSHDTYTLLEDMFITAQGLLALGRAPKGSLMSFRGEVNALQGRLLEAQRRYELSVGQSTRKI